MEINDNGIGGSDWYGYHKGEGISGYLSDPNNSDTDEDGFPDGLEYSAGSDLNNSASTPLNHGLVAWYPFDGNASDMSGNGNNGTVYGATLSTDRHGQANKAYSFDGVDDWVDCRRNERLCLSLTMKYHDLLGLTSRNTTSARRQHWITGQE